mmetsp:Transcript_16804/g.26989  ORF Transcript_16804/g.26989 Transcript_16804/m.26989 type:complete len:156 (-) Transcript_16804:41-508(-)
MDSASFRFQASSALQFQALVFKLNAQLVLSSSAPPLYPQEDGSGAAGGGKEMGKGKGKRALVLTPAHPKRESGLLSTCGHVGCSRCLKQNADLQECGVFGCDCPARHSSVVDAVSLGTERVAGPGGPQVGQCTLYWLSSCAQQNKCWKNARAPPS